MAILPTLVTRRLVLRPFDAADADVVRRLAGDPRVAATTLNIPHPYPDGAAEAWIARHAGEAADDRTVTLAVTRDDAVVGAVGLRLEPAHRRAPEALLVGA